MKRLDHLQAHESHAAERYLLGELSAPETEDFERHYFECEQCAAAVEAGGEFIANARASLAQAAVFPAGRAPAEQRRKPFLGSFAAAWRQPAFALPLAAALLFGFVALYQGTVVIPGVRRGMDAARVLPAFQLTGASRGEGSALHVPASAPSFALSADIPPGERFQQYVCVLSGDNKDIFRVIAHAPLEGQPITILVPVKGLQPGNLKLTIFGLGPNGEQADKISDWAFELQFTQ